MPESSYFSEEGPGENVVEIAARAGIYSLLARLFGAELDHNILAFLRENKKEALDFSLPEPEKETEWLQATRAEFSRLFLMNVFPYESIYTGRDLMLNTPETEQVREFYDRYGSGTGTYEKLLPDHLGRELEFMAYLAIKQARTEAGRRVEAANRLKEAQGYFLREHLLAWLPIFALAIQYEARESFYRELALFTRQFTCQDLQYLEEEGSAASTPLSKSTPLLDIPPEEVSLKQLVRHLITPVDCGFFLSKGEMYRLAHDLQLPAGFSDRFKFLQGLFEAAGEYDLLPSLLGEIEKVAKRYRDDLIEWRREENVIGELLNPWLEKIQASLALLERAAQC